MDTANSNKEQFIKILSLAAINYPNFQLDKERLQLFYKMLRDIDITVLETAMLSHISSSSFPPTIADLRKKSVEVENNNMALSDATKAWGEVTAAISEFGYYEPKKALESMTPLTRKIVKSIGWSDLCHSSQIGVERGQFIKMYNSYKDRVLYEKQLPKFVKTQIKQIQINKNNLLNTKVVPLINNQHEHIEAESTNISNKESNRKNLQKLKSVLEIIKNSDKNNTE